MFPLYDSEDKITFLVSYIFSDYRFGILYCNFLFILFRF